MKRLKQIMSVLFFVCLVTTLVACKSTSVVPPTTIDNSIIKTVKEVIHDTVFTTQKDSSYYRAYLNCVNGKVVLKEKTVPLSTKGNHLQPPNVNIKDNILTVDCKAEAQKLFAQWKDTYTTELQKLIKKVPYPVPAQISWWQKTQMILGDLFLVLLALLGLGLAFKNRI